jgi:cardiolipin synthase
MPGPGRPSRDGMPIAIPAQLLSAAAGSQRAGAAVRHPNRMWRFFRRIFLCAVAGAGLAACSSLPKVDGDMRNLDRDRVQLAGARGPLSYKQSQEVLARLKARSPETAIFDHHLAIEEAAVDTPLSLGNKVTLLQDGPATYKAMFASIRAAKDSVNMETYIIEDDEIGRQFADLFIETQKRGVQVALLYDSVGSLHTPAEFFKRLKDAGIKVTQFNPVNPLTAKAGWEINRRDHRKLLVVDGQIAFLGGINISSVYSAGSSGHFTKVRIDKEGADKTHAQPWRDTQAQVEGPVVGQFQKLFVDEWNKQKGEPLPPRKYFPVLADKGQEVVRAIGSTSDDPYSVIYITLLSAIASAETSVHLTNAYFVPDPQLLEALKGAAARGVDVTLILPSKTDFWAVFQAGRSFYGELLEAGVKIYERRDALLHSKTALVDGVWSTVGSTNLDWRSFLDNDEINVVVLGPGFGAQMEAMFQNDLAHSKRITVEDWKQRPISDRVKEFSARLWQYLL